MGIVKPIISTETDISGITSVLSEIKSLASTAADRSNAAANDAATAATKSTAAATSAGNVDSRLTSTRAGYLDYLANSTYGLNAIKSAADAAKLSSTRLGYIDLLKNLTATRAGYLDLLGNSTNGLAAIKSAVGNVNTIKSVQRGVVNCGTQNTASDGAVQLANGSGGVRSYTAYIDITISSVTLSKSYVILDTLCVSGTSYNYSFVPVLTSATNLRVYFDGQSSAANLSTKAGFSWQVVEFK